MPWGAVVVEDVGLVIGQVVGGIEVVCVRVGSRIGRRNSKRGGAGEGLLGVGSGGPPGHDGGRYGKVSPNAHEADAEANRWRTKEMLELGERASAEAETEEDLDSHHQVMGETGLEWRDSVPAPGYIKCPWSGGENNFFLSHHITHFVTDTSRQSTSVTVRQSKTCKL